MDIEDAIGLNNKKLSIASAMRNAGEQELHELPGTSYPRKAKAVNLVRCDKNPNTII